MHADIDPLGLEVAPDGWCVQAIRQVSPNCDRRPDGMAVDLLVIHNISLPPGRFGGPYIADLFCNRLDCDADPSFAGLRDLRVSAHFLIRRDGALVQFVSGNARAWHAGVSRFGGRERCNDFSIGIELEGSDTEAFSSSQYQTLAGLAQALQNRYPLIDVAGHEHIAPGRKTDPGPFFDWSLFRAAFNSTQRLALTHRTLHFPSSTLKSQPKHVGNFSPASIKSDCIQSVQALELVPEQMGTTIYSEFSDFRLELSIQVSWKSRQIRRQKNKR